MYLSHCFILLTSHYCGLFSINITVGPPAGICAAHQKPLSPEVQPVFSLFHCLLLWVMPCQFVYEDIMGDSIVKALLKSRYTSSLLCHHPPSTASHERWLSDSLSVVSLCKSMLAIPNDHHVFISLFPVLQWKWVFIRKSWD